jgi:hypothetical protein
MGLSIKNREAHQMAEELSKLTGVRAYPARRARAAPTVREARSIRGASMIIEVVRVRHKRRRHDRRNKTAP